MKTSQNDNLSNGLRNYYQGRSLPTQTVQRLLAQAETSKPATPWLRRPLSWVATLFLALIVGQFFYHQQSLQQNLTTLVLEEIAMNHNKKLDVEYQQTRPEILRTAMQRLDFSLNLPADIQRDFQLIGGRYCSIQGGLAAQLKVRNNTNGDVSTLYVTTLTEKLRRIKEQHAAQGDVDIHLWQQQGRFFGLATDKQ
jgi:hypothetical protein